MEEYRGNRVAVIGATGFIGSHLVHALIQCGAKVLSVARGLRDRHDLPGHADHRFTRCDIRDPTAAPDLLCDFRPSIVFHLAACPDGVDTAEHLADCVATNTLGALHVLDACTRANTGRFVLADSCKVYGNAPVPHRASQLADPISGYAISKAAAWQAAKLISLRTGLGVVGLRFTFIYGPGQNWNLVKYVQECVEEDRSITLQGGSQTRDPLYIDDAVDALLAAGIRPDALGHSMPIGGGSEISVRDFSRRILEALGKGVPVIENADELRLTEIYRSVSDNKAATHLLGWSPKVRLEDGLMRTVSRTATPKERTVHSAGLR
jgi:nucleoside-diphosphate-sugar epimerase